MSAQKRPLDFTAFRALLATTVGNVTGRPCILAEQKGQGGQPLPRPELPYLTLKLTTPAAKDGDDSRQYEDVPPVDDDPVTQVKVTTGGIRRMSVSFQSFAVEQEDAYGIMCLLQSALEQLGVQQTLRRGGVAVWVIGAVADLTQVLNTGYEARAQMDVQFGVAANVTETVDVVQSVAVDGTVKTQGGTTVQDDFTVP